MAQVRTVGILMGGFSSEREVSLKSGTAVAAALRSSGCTVETIDFHSREELRAKLDNCTADCIFNALHGRFGEDGEVQQILDERRIPYTGSGADASRLAMDKVASRRIFQRDGLRVPEYQIFNKNAVMDRGFFSDFPLVIKPAHEGSSIGLSMVSDALSLLWAVEYAFRFDPVVIVEKYVRGREITVGILDEQPLPIVEVIPKNSFYDFQAKYTAGLTEYRVPAQLPADITEKARAAALQAHRLLRCRCFSRVDMIIDGCEPVVLEVNTIPGMTATSLLPKAAAANGIGFPELCLKMVDAALREPLGTTIA